MTSVAAEVNAVRGWKVTMTLAPGDTAGVVTCPATERDATCEVVVHPAPPVPAVVTACELIVAPNEDTNVSPRFTLVFPVEGLLFQKADGTVNVTAVVEVTLQPAGRVTSNCTLNVTTAAVHVAPTAPPPKDVVHGDGEQVPALRIEVPVMAFG